MDNPQLIMGSGVGVRTTVDLTGGLKYGLIGQASIGKRPAAAANPTVDRTRFGRITPCSTLVYQLRADKRKRWGIP